ncbi:hypothetical protein B0O99DRAFT_656406 [Bisporella sp. PMI_857]|nr:hypothetical protein B0O99DRAFT_656406 [Bisporella sp. PMI_857]
MEPPIINGVSKPKKPGGYQDSGADIAYALQSGSDIEVLTPQRSPDPHEASGWSFPDTEEGILSALRTGASHLWANTILFASHPIQMSSRVSKYEESVRVIGQPPLLVEQYDDKWFVNNLLRSKSIFTMPHAWLIYESPNVEAELSRMNLSYPIVAKPIRGRGSYGVKVCYTQQQLLKHVKGLFKDSPLIMMEEYLSGEEATISVMPPSKERPEYWSMPIVTRFNHKDGIAPYNGVVAVTVNSKVVSQKEYEDDLSYSEAARQCAAVAKFLQVTAPIRIDIRRFEPGGKFALFDVNMKPNMTGPGRPGREDQASLTALAAAGLGWDYSKLLRHMLHSSCTLRQLREARLEV